MNEDIKKNGVVDEEIVEEVTFDDNFDDQNEFMETEDLDIEGLKRQLDEINEKYIRICADYTNFKKRHAAELRDIEKRTTIGFLKQFLPLMDSFVGMEQNNMENTDEMIAGIKAIKAQFYDIMENMGVSTIPSDGEKFDAKYHDVVMMNSASDEGPGTIIKTYMRGYTYGNDVLRCSIVEVAGE